MAKISVLDSSGTSFHDSKILTSISELKEKFGEPRYEENFGTDKTNIEWVGETENGDIFTIYDWKEYRVLSETEYIYFNIGAKEKWISEQAKNELVKLLNNG